MAQTATRWVGWCDARAGWCVYLNRGGLSASVVAGPFQTREDAEALLGPELKQPHCIEAGK